MTTRAYLLDDDVSVIALEGRVDLPVARSLEEALDYLLEQGSTRIVVDLASVTYMASAGLKALLTGLRRVRQHRGDLKIAAVQERVREVFEMAGLDQVLVLYPTVAEAAASFG